MCWHKKQNCNFKGVFDIFFLPYNCQADFSLCLIFFICEIFLSLLKSNSTLFVMFLGMFASYYDGFDDI